MKAILSALLSLGVVTSSLGDEPRIVRILQFYYESDGDLDAVESWIDLNEGGRILQKFYDATARTNTENPSLEHFELVQMEEYVGGMGRVWHPPLGEPPGALRILDRRTVEDTLRRISLLGAYLGPVIKQAEEQTRPTWDEESLAELKRLVELAGREGGQGRWTDRLGFTLALKFRAGGMIEWVNHFQDGKPVFVGKVFEVDDFPPIEESR